MTAHKTDMDLQKLSNKGTVRQVAKGGYYFAEGDEGSSMYILLKGRVEVSILGSEGLRSIVELEPGGLRIDRSNFIEVIRSEPDLAWRVLKSLSKRVRQLDYQLYKKRSRS
ncbi:MAG: Crp/Fnr family transcriptional regulator [Candidatus Sumerlaeia bacterium]